MADAEIDPGVSQQATTAAEEERKLPEPSPGPATTQLVQAAASTSAMLALEVVRACLAEADESDVGREALRTLAVTRALLATMAEQSSDSDVVVTVSKLLARVLDKPYPNLIELPPTAVPILTSLLEQHAASATVVTHVSSALRFVARLESQQTLLGEGGRLALLVSLLERYAEDASVVVAITSALWNAVLPTANVEQAGLPAVQLLLRLLRAHMAHAETTREIAGSLRNMLTSDAFRSHAVREADGIALTVTALRTHGSSPDVIGVLASLLRVMAGDGGSMDVSLRVNGVLPLLLELITAHASHPKATKELFYALAQTAITDENERLAVNAGALRIAMATLRAYAGDASVCTAVCHALRYLCWATPHKIAFVADEGVPLVLEMLKRHMADEALVRIACRVVRNACIGSAPNTRAFVQAGVTSIVVTAWSGTNDTDTIVAIAIAVTDLAHEDESFRTAFADAGGLPLVLSALQRADLTQVHARTLVATLRNVCNDTGAKTILVSAGAVNIMVDTLLRFSASADVCYLTCGALENIARGYADAKKAVVLAKGCEAIIAALRRHINVAEVASHACGALQNVAVVEDLKAAVVDAGGAAVLAATLRTHATESRVLAAALGALHNIALHVPNRSALCAAGNLLLVLAVVRQNDNDATIVRLGLQVICSLAEEPLMVPVLRLARCERTAVALQERYNTATGSISAATISGIRDACTALLRKLKVKES